RLAHGDVRQVRVVGAELRALAVDLGVGVGEVDENALDADAGDDQQRAGLGGVLHLVEDVSLDLEIPGIVNVAGLHRAARRRGRVAAAFQLDALEPGLIAEAIIFVDLVGDNVAGLELGDLVRPGADGRHVELVVAGGRADGTLEDVLRQDLAAVTSSEGHHPGRVRVGEMESHGVIVDDLDILDDLVGGDGRRAGFGVRDVFPGEAHVLGGERRAVRPDDVVAQFPGDAHAVLGDAAVLETGELGSEGEDGFASSVEVDQRLEDQAGSAGVLVTLREVRVEDGRRLPVEDTHEVAAAAAHAPALGAAGLFLGGLFLLFLGLLGWFGFG